MSLVDFAATVRQRITDNAASLGGIKQVLDRDEDPDIIAQNASMLPTACVIPIGEGKLTAQFSFGSTDLQEDYQLHVVIYYRQSTDNALPYSDIDVLRAYAKVLMKLFNNPTVGAANTCCFNQGVIYKATSEISPYQARDYVLDRILTTFFIKMMEV